MSSIKDLILSKSYKNNIHLKTNSVNAKTSIYVNQANVNQADGGSTANRPENPVPGYMYFDTVINIPIFYNSVQWVTFNGKPA